MTDHTKHTQPSALARFGTLALSFIAPTENQVLRLLTQADDRKPAQVRHDDTAA